LDRQVASRDKKHILIVEDAPDLQALLARFFQGEGYTVSRAFNGQEALDWLRTTPHLPSLILLDIMMPVMDGIEFRQQQKQDTRLSAIPVVVMTADSNPLSKALKLDVVEIIRKPITDLDHLLGIAARLEST
jgi:CheY-like chemotaxis protein